MKKMERVIALALASLMVLVSPMTVLAEENVEIIEEVSEIESAPEIILGSEEEEVPEVTLVAEEFEEIVTALDGLQEEYAVGFSLTSAMMQEKKMLSYTLEKLNTCIPDTDYVDKQIVVTTDSKERADEIAEGFKGEVVAYQDNVATIQIDIGTVEAVMMAADEDMKLPAVYPNYLYRLEGKAFDEMQKSSTEIKEMNLSEMLKLEDTKKALEQETQTVERVIEISEDGTLTEAATGRGTVNINDPDLAKQWHHDNIDTFNAWKVTKGSGVKVAVLDSGINTSHVEFSGRLETASKVTWTEATPEDIVGHGTHVAGLIAAAANNGAGGTGIAPEASILAVKVLEKYGDGASGTTADICAGINYAVEQGARVINMSLGGMSDAEDILYQNAITAAWDKGVVVVAAAGNDTYNLKKTKVSPACLNDVVTVAATTKRNELAWYSNYGMIDVAAPGGDSNRYEADGIYSSSIAGAGNYEYMSGTSMACPVVAGVAALVLAADSTIPATREGANLVANKLKSTAVNVGSKTSFGAGVVNAAAAVGAISIYTKDNNFNVVSKKSIQLLAKYGKTTDKVVWSIPETVSAASISKSGKFKANSVDTVTVVPVTATLGTVSDTVNVTIYPKVEDISLLSDKSVVIEYHKDTILNISSAVPYTFKSSNSKVVNVDSTGRMLGISNGTAKVTATAVGGKKVTVKVKVVGTPYEIAKIVPATSKLESMGDAFRQTWIAQRAGLSNSYCAVTSAGKNLKMKVVAEWPYTTASNKKIEWLMGPGSDLYTGSSYTGATISQKGVVKVPKNIEHPVSVLVGASPETGMSIKASYVIASKPIKSFHFGSSLSGIVYKIVSKTNATVAAGTSGNVDYSLIVSDRNSEAYNPYPYIVSTDNSVAVAEYDDSRTNYSIKITGLKKGKCKIYLYSMDGAYKKGTINVTVE